MFRENRCLACLKDISRRQPQARTCGGKCRTKLCRWARATLYSPSAKLKQREALVRLGKAEPLR